MTCVTNPPNCSHRYSSDLLLSKYPVMQLLFPPSSPTNFSFLPPIPSSRPILPSPACFHHQMWLPKYTPSPPLQVVHPNSPPHNWVRRSHLDPVRIPLCVQRTHGEVNRSPTLVSWRHRRTR